MSRSDVCIAIDGPAGSGKSTVARTVARRLGLRYLDTGAMYRAATWLALRDGVHDADALTGLAETMRLELSDWPDDVLVRVEGTDVTTAIRSPEVGAAVSAVSAVPGVRRVLVDRQRAIVAGGGIVVEGRDIGTVVLPDAPVKIFLTATGDARAQRRAAERGAVSPAGVAVTRVEIDARDRLDSGRTVSPLTRADDAVEIDTTTMTIDQVVAAVLARVDAVVPSGSRP